MFFDTIQDTSERTKAETLYYKYRKLMFKEAYQIINDIALAEDCVSEAFIRVIGILHKIKDTDSPKTRNFLVIICKNVAKDMLKKITKEVATETFEKEDLISQSTQNPLNITINKEGVERIAKVISELDPKYKDIVILRSEYDLGMAEIADMLRINPETARKRLNRARKLILEKLSKEEAK